MSAPIAVQLAEAGAVVRSFGHATTGPQDAAALLLALAGDGTGGPSLLADVAAAITRITGHAAEQLPADTARYLVEAGRMVEMTLTQVVGDYLAGALDLLEQPGRLPVVEFTVRHGLGVEGDVPVPARPTTVTAAPAAAPGTTTTPNTNPVPAPVPVPVPAGVLIGAGR